MRPWWAAAVLALSLRRAEEAEDILESLTQRLTARLDSPQRISERLTTAIADEMQPQGGVTTLTQLLDAVGFSNPARPLDAPEAVVILRNVRDGLNSAAGRVPRDAPLDPEIFEVSAAVVLINNLSALRPFTPHLTAQGQAVPRALFYKELIVVALRRTQLKARVEPILADQAFVRRLEARRAAASDRWPSDSCNPRDPGAARAAFASSR